MAGNLPKIKGLVLIEQLGQGDFGTVYSCKDDNNNKFALKVLRTDRDYIDNVAKLYGSRKGLLEHESIVSFEESGQYPNLVPSEVIGIDGIYYRKMPIYDGTLDDFLKKNKLNETVFYTIASQLIQGVAQLHSKDGGYVHFDIKPDSILINQKEGRLECALSDFGSCVKIGAWYYKLGNIKRYSPKHANEDFGPHNDVNLVGKVLLEMLTGSYPGKEAVIHFDRDKERTKIENYIASLLDVNLSPTEKYKSLVEESLGKLPEYAARIKDLVRKAMYEEFKDGNELLKEFKRIENRRKPFKSLALFMRSLFNLGERMTRIPTFRS